MYNNVLDGRNIHLVPGKLTSECMVLTVKNNARYVYTAMRLTEATKTK